MAILLSRPTRRTAATRHPARRLVRTEGTTWVLDLAGTDVVAVRRAVAQVLATDARWSRVRSLADGRLRTVSCAESVLWADQMVSSSSSVGGDLARAHSLGGLPLERLPFAVVVAPDAVVLRWHRGIASQSEAHLLLQQLVRAATRGQDRQTPSSRSEP